MGQDYHILLACSKGLGRRPEDVAGAGQGLLVLADVSAYLEELAWWLDLKRVPKAAYRDEMCVD